MVAITAQDLLPSANVSTEEERLSTVTVTTDSITAQIKAHPDALAALAMPETFEYGWPPVFLSMWAYVTGLLTKSRDFSKLALGLPRGFGKTTFVKILVLYTILFTNRSFILILSKTQGHAVNIISDVMDMLSESNLVQIFGNWKIGSEVDRQEVKKFSFRGRNIVLAGLGAGGSVRGLNLKNLRPDLIIFEDIQSREDADSATISGGLERWMLGTAMKAKSPKGCLFLFVANMYPTPHSILKKLQQNRTWIKWICGGILQDPKTGELSSLWEELQPLNQLLEEFEGDQAAGHPEIFYAEVLNDPNASVNDKIDVGKIPRIDPEYLGTHQGNFIVIDPASGKVNGDDVSNGYFQVHEGNPVLWELDYGKFSPGETIWSALKLCGKYQCRAIFVEGNAYQSTLCYWFKFIMEQAGIKGIEVVPIYSGSRAKNSRILDMFKQLPTGEIGLHDQVRSSVFAQLTGFMPLRTDNTDGILDLLTYAPRILGEFSEYLVNSTDLEEQVFRSEMLHLPNEQQLSPI